MSDLYQCGNCGHTLSLGRHDLPTVVCPGCNVPGEYRRIDYSSGYDRPHLLNLWVRAPSLERVAGCGDPEEGLVQALNQALTDPTDAESLRDAAAFIETQLNGLDVAAMNERAAAELED